MSCDDDAPSHVPVDEASADAVLEPTPLRVYFGTCGWTEPGLISCKRFYPSGIRDPIDRLRFYARKLPSVEIDTTNYAFASDRRLVVIALLDCNGRFRAVQALNASNVLNARSATSALLNYTAG